MHSLLKQNETIVPQSQFFGYNYKTPKWPLDESYAMYTLAVFKPRRDKINKLKHLVLGHRKILEDFMYHPAFPMQQLGEILQCKRSDDIQFYDDKMRGDDNYTPPDGRTNNVDNDAATANKNGATQRREGNEEENAIYVNLSDDIFDSLDDRATGHNCAEIVDRHILDAVNDYKLNLYDDLNEGTATGVRQPLCIFKRNCIDPRMLQQETRNCWYSTIYCIRSNYPIIFWLMTMRLNNPRYVMYL